MSSYYIYY